MNFKTLLQVGVVSTALMAANSAYAIEFSTQFTADNVVSEFSYAENGSVTNFDLGSTGNLSNWQAASSIGLSLVDNAAYDFIWRTNNLGSPNAGNPAGFLAQFNLGTTEYLSSTDSNIWSISSDGINWTNLALTSYGTNAPSDPNVWGSIAGINHSSEWLWDANNGGNLVNDSLYFKASITSAVPEPSIVALMLGGLGLVGFMANRRKKV